MPDFTPLTPGQSAALVRFAARHGRAWKVQLRAAWMDSSAEPGLHRLRNTHGPSWLAAFKLEAPATPDFTAYAHPVLAVPCPDCRRREGRWCVRPSGHQAMDLHDARRAAADRAFVDQHGPKASVEFVDGRRMVNPLGRAGIRPKPE